MSKALMFVWSGEVSYPWTRYSTIRSLRHCAASSGVENGLLRTRFGEYTTPRYVGVHEHFALGASDVLQERECRSSTPTGRRLDRRLPNEAPTRRAAWERVVVELCTRRNDASRLCVAASRGLCVGVCALHTLQPRKCVGRHIRRLRQTSRSNAPNSPRSDLRKAHPNPI